MGKRPPLVLLSTTLMVGCPTDPQAMYAEWPPDGVVGTWEEGGSEGTTGDRMIGTFNGGGTLDDVDRTADVYSEWHRVSFGADDSWQWIIDRVYLDEATSFASCTERTAWSGTFTRADAEGRLRVTLVESSGELVREGCADPSEDGTTSAPAFGERTLDVSTFSQSCFRSCTHYHELTLTEPAPPDVSSEIVYEGSRVDRAESVELTLREDGSFRAVVTADVLEEDVWRDAGCTVTTTVDGSYELGTEPITHDLDPIQYRTFALTPAGDASVVRTSCVNASDDGETAIAADAALGALGTAYEVGFWDGALQVGYRVEGNDTAASFLPGS